MISAFKGPLIAFGKDSGSPDYNPEIAPSLFWGGIGLLDPRSPFDYNHGQNFGSLTAGWQTSPHAVLTLNAVPMTKSTTLLSTAAHITANTALTLVSTAADGVCPSCAITRADTGAAATGLLQLDPAVASVTANITSGSNVLTVTALGAAGGHCYGQLHIGMTLTDSSTAANIPTGAYIIGYGTGAGGVGTYYMSANAAATATGDTVTAILTTFNPTATQGGVTPYSVSQFCGWPFVIPFGQVGTIRLYNPACLISRAVSITSTTSQVDATVFTVKGYDIYGYPITETITTSGTSATTTNGKKAFKFIASVTPSKTDATGNYSVGTLDVVGLPLRSDIYTPVPGIDLSIWMNNAAISSTTGYTAADLTSPATATTGDVRGTYALQTASDGTKPLVIKQSPLIANLGVVDGGYTAAVTGSGAVATASGAGVGLYGVTHYSS